MHEGRYQVDKKVVIGASQLPQSVLGLGCWVFGGEMWAVQEDADSIAAMEAAWECGANHFDTATGYGAGRSERLVGAFISDRRDRVCIASKAFPDELTPDAALRAVDASRARLQVDSIDLYYVHWPRAGQDMRPYLEGLATAMGRGWIGAIGVSNFTVDDLERSAGAAPIAANQICYNLLWRVHEPDVIPYCAARGIAVITYSSIAQGILTGKFPKEPRFEAGDHRPKTALFGPDVWPAVHDAVGRMDSVARECGRPLHHLAIRWAAEQAGISMVLVGARNAAQARDNAAAMEGALAPDVLAELTAISNEVRTALPAAGNIFGINP